MEPVTPNTTNYGRTTDECGRRNYQRNYTRVRRANETEEQRRQRLARLSERQQERLANETAEQRQRRLAGLSKDRKRRMQREPSEEREQRRERNRIKQQIRRRNRSLRGRGFLPRTAVLVLFTTPANIEYEHSGGVASEEALRPDTSRNPGAVPTTIFPVEEQCNQVVDSDVELKQEHVATSDEEPLWKFHDPGINSGVNDDVNIKSEMGDPLEPSDVHDYDICIPDIKLECALSVHACDHECIGKDCNFCFPKVNRQHAQSQENHDQIYEENSSNGRNILEDTAESGKYNFKPEEMFGGETYDREFNQSENL